MSRDCLLDGERISIMATSDEMYEVEIVARNAKNQTATKSLEYRSVKSSTPAEAADELYKGLTQASKDRCREIDEKV